MTACDKVSCGGWSQVNLTETASNNFIEAWAALACIKTGTSLNGVTGTNSIAASALRAVE